MKKQFLLTALVALAVCPQLLAKESISTVYLNNGTKKQIEFRVTVKGLESAKRYVIAVGASSPVSVRYEEDPRIPEGAKIEKTEKKFTDKDVVRINPAIPELKSVGYELNVQEVSPEAEIRCRIAISYEELEKLKAAKSPIFLYLSRIFSAEQVFYIVDYYEINPASLVR
ncbi:MAG TPA: hypothetical protein VGK99_05785 [Acidobacteriota bacterium]|jgi:hypothetical protein